jgi:cysteine desulfurase/selenocysteine lyase
MNEMKGELDHGGNMTNYCQDKTKIVTVKPYFECVRTVNPIKYNIDKAHAVSCCFNRVISKVPHLRPNVQELDCDFMFSLGIKNMWTNI